MFMAGELVKIAKELDINLIYKTSFDKANRTSGESPRGLGLEASLPVFMKIRKEYKVPVLTDIHLPQQAKLVATAADILQIPAFLCRQTDLLEAAAKTGRMVNVKKGQFLSPKEVKPIIEKLHKFECKNVMITERGTSFGYNTLVNDFTGLDVMRQYRVPLIFDATHSVQRPGAGEGCTLGNREFVPSLCRAACASGVAGLFIETHQDPDNAPSDGPNMVRLDKLKEILEPCLKIDRIVKGYK